MFFLYSDVFSIASTDINNSASINMHHAETNSSKINEEVCFLAPMNDKTIGTDVFR